MQLHDTPSDAERQIIEQTELSKKMEDLIDELDAAVFSGDEFISQNKAIKLKFKLHQWLREIKLAVAGVYEPNFVESDHDKSHQLPITFEFTPAANPPEKHYQYSVLVMAHNQKAIMMEAIYTRPAGSLKPSWFVVTGYNGIHEPTYSPLENVLYWSNTRDIQLDPDLLPQASPKLT